jgi:hypothetical protein
MKKNKIASTFRLDSVTKSRLKEMAFELEYSEADIIKLLVSQYYKHQVAQEGDNLLFYPIFSMPCPCTLEKELESFSGKLYLPDKHYVRE